jgi:hypothetical protein
MNGCAYEVPKRPVSFRFNPWSGGRRRTNRRPLQHLAVSFFCWADRETFDLNRSPERYIRGNYKVEGLSTRPLALDRGPIVGPAMVTFRLYCGVDNLIVVLHSRLHLFYSTLQCGIYACNNCEACRRNSSNHDCSKGGRCQHFARGPSASPRGVRAGRLLRKIDTRPRVDGAL